MKLFRANALLCVALTVGACGAPPSPPGASQNADTSSTQAGASGGFEGTDGGAGTSTRANASGSGINANDAADEASTAGVSASKVVATSVSVCVPVTQSVATSMDAYKHDVACHVHARSIRFLYEGAPPPMLKSVTVLSVKVDGLGHPTSIAVLRSNGFRNLDQLAIRSVRDSAPLPRPSSAALKRGVAEFTETWLFRDDGRFQLRSLAAVQAAGEP